MTVVAISNTSTFIGLSSDSKPTDAPAGSRFTELDTGVVYAFDGGSTWFAEGGFVSMIGKKVSRAATTTPQSGHTPYFTVAGGRVKVFELLGQVTVLTPVGANNAKLTAYPTVGTAVDLCATADIASQEAGALLGITGTPANALTKAVAGARIGQALPVIVAPGTIDFACDESKTGSTKWDLYYLPLDEGATVVAA